MLQLTKDFQAENVYVVQCDLFTLTYTCSSYQSPSYQGDAMAKSV
jgi:hypothetical protein